MDRKEKSLIQGPVLVVGVSRLLSACKILRRGQGHRDCFEGWVDRRREDGVEGVWGAHEWMGRMRSRHGDGRESLGKGDRDR